MICKILPETRASKGFAGTKPIKVSQNPGIPPLSAYSLEAWTPKLAKLIPSPGLNTTLKIRPITVAMIVVIV